MVRVVALAEDSLLYSVGLPHTIEMLDMGSNFDVDFSEARLTTMEKAAGTWCWHVSVTSKSV